MMKLFNNQRGVSLVQLVVAMGITGIFSVVMMRQQTNISKQQRRFKQKSDMTSFSSQIGMQLTSKQSCEASFKDLTLSTTDSTALTNLKMTLPNGENKTILEVGKKYIGEKIKVNSINAVVVNPEKIKVNIEFENLAIKQGYNKIIESQEYSIFSEAVSGGIKVKDCFYSDQKNLEDATVNSHILCAGDGVKVDGTFNCQVKDYFNPYNSTLDCPAGKSLVDITYNDTTYSYQGVCEDIFQPMSGCIGNRIKQVNENGSLVCLNAVDMVNTGMAATLYENSNCTLQVTGGRVGLSCTCTPSCAPASSICAGTIDNSSNHCGSPCGTAGTKTTGSCASCTPSTCDAPAATTCVGDVASGSDNCGNPCTLNGTLSTGPCAPACVGCSADPTTACVGDDASGVDSCGALCTVAGTKTDGVCDSSPAMCTDDMTGAGSYCCSETTKICEGSGTTINALDGPYAGDGLFLFNDSQCGVDVIEVSGLASCLGYDPGTGCTVTSCDADPSTVCSGSNATGTDNCGDPCSVPGTKTDGSCANNCADQLSGSPGEFCCTNSQMQCCDSDFQDCIDGTGSFQNGSGPYDDGLFLFNNSQCGDNIQFAVGDRIQYCGGPNPCLCPIYAADICEGQTQTATDTCGDTCSVTGIKTDGICSSDCDPESGARVELDISIVETATCPNTSAEYDSWLSDPHVSSVWIPINFHGVTVEGTGNNGKIMATSSQMTDECHHAYTQSSGNTYYIPTGNHLIAKGSVSDFETPHIIHINADGFASFTKCVIPSGGGSSNGSGGANGLNGSTGPSDQK